MDDQTISLTAQIVSAHVANNEVTVQKLAAFIREVHKALATVGQAAIKPINAEPAVAESNSLFADRIVCLDCGKSFKTLKRHIKTDHQMSPAGYRIKWSLPSSYPMIAPEYAATRSRIARATGLGVKVVDLPPPKKPDRSKRN